MLLDDVPYDHQVTLATSPDERSMVAEWKVKETLSGVRDLQFRDAQQPTFAVGSGLCFNPLAPASVYSAPLLSWARLLRRLPHKLQALPAPTCPPLRWTKSARA